MNLFEIQIDDRLVIDIYLCLASWKVEITISVLKKKMLFRPENLVFLIKKKFFFSKKSQSDIKRPQHLHNTPFCTRISDHNYNKL